MISQTAQVSPKMRPAQPNQPVWNQASAKEIGPFHEIWFLKLNDPATKRALWLRFTLLVTSNGFRRIAETWAIYFQRNSPKEVSKIAVKQSFDISAFRSSNNQIAIGECELSDQSTRGVVQSKGNAIEWNFTISKNDSTKKDSSTTFNLVPETLSKFGIVKNKAVTVAEDLRFTGMTIINGEKVQWEDAPGMQSHISGPHAPHSWIWSHSNCFVDDKGAEVEFIFEGLTARPRIWGTFSGPSLSSFYFNYQGKPYFFNSVLSALRLRSTMNHSLTEWRFRADQGELSFQGEVKAEPRDFVGITMEDTNGSFLYCANSKLSDLNIHIYRSGKLEAAYYAHGTAAFEIVERKKNPYIPLMI